MTYSPPTQYATEKQLSFIKALLEQRVVTTEVKEHVEGFIVSGAMTKAEASKRIEWLLAQPKVEKPKPVYADVPEGMHKIGETIWKVYRTRNGHQVAAQLREIDGAWGFEYRGKAGLKGLSEATRMPAEEAAKFGKTYGICVRCAAQLTDERSIFAGYGPVCAKNQGWPYPTMDEAMSGLGLGVYAPDSEPTPLPPKSEPWYEAATVEEAMANLDAITEIEFDSAIPEPSDEPDWDAVEKSKKALAEGLGPDDGPAAVSEILAKLVIDAIEAEIDAETRAAMPDAVEMKFKTPWTEMPDDGDILSPEERAAYEAGKPSLADQLLPEDI